MTAQPSHNSPKELCAESVSIFVPLLTFKKTIEATPRIELRRCALEKAGDLQILAWDGVSSEHVLLVDPAAFGINQVAVNRSHIVIVLTAPTTDRLFVFGFENTGPRLLLQRNSKNAISVKSEDRLITVRITKDDGSLAEEYHFSTKR